MTFPINFQEATERRSPSFPLSNQGGNLFLGWGPRL
jgi:hypothetical protein